MNFIEKLRQSREKRNSYLCVGLDSDTDKLPDSVMKARTHPESDDPQLEFNSRIINATSEDACAYKINTAFYECRGSVGWKCLEQTIKLIPADIPVIVDAKRGDIGNTSAKYALMVYENLKADAVTVSPYLGFDSVEPFLKYGYKCAFILCHTSNPSSEDFQHAAVLRQDGFQEPVRLFELIAMKAAEWNEVGPCGLVMGANYPRYFERIKKIAPGLPVLVPGIGAQGGDLEKTVANLAGGDFVINSSRGIIFASSAKDFEMEAQRQAAALKRNINRILGRYADK